jgi:hypothetical protein
MVNQAAMVQPQPAPSGSNRDFRDALAEQDVPRLRVI